ncbi:phage upper tail fiber protein [Nocardia gipuzkoensis]
MTVIADHIVDIGHSRAVRQIGFTAREIRQDHTGSGIVIRYNHLVEILPDGSFTTPNLDPGPAQVTIGNQVYSILVPDSGGTVRLWDLIDARLPAPPPTGLAEYVRNGGGVDRIVWMTEAEYTALPARDPNTTYLTY